MTPFKLLCELTGLSTREAGDFLSVRHDTVKSWSSGRNPTPDGVLDQMRDLIDAIENAASGTLDLIEEKTPDTVEIYYCTSDNQARARGLPCVGAHNAMLARVVAECELPIILQPLEP